MGSRGGSLTAHAANTCTVGESADHCGELASSGSSRMRLSSCTGYLVRVRGRGRVRVGVRGRGRVRGYS